MPRNADIPNVYIIGPQSTGKTTLVHKLQKDLQHWLIDTSIEDPYIISEVARTVLIKHNYSAQDIQTSTTRCLELQQLILEAQAIAEKEALQTSTWFISDRSGIDPLVYAKRYASLQGMQDLQLLTAWVEIKKRMKNALIVVCEAGTPWLMDDGVRLMPNSHDEWMDVFHDFCALLDQVGFEYCVLSRTMLDISKRVEFIRMKWTEKRQSAARNSHLKQ
ncbi:p-loop containing nucleoside triphosphate hydrolase [Fusarium sporotrichioides]|uniref:p-loop containing nucleoside triphosphate hydrolase n=1 Tax=Fusarium sporotrichioides TaxID=5514 RepID=A0A395SJA3_FUSSP|nr:p-loop containing nucleoside triphosphate hydrolase [Fusarium sporotrichioides]